VDLAEAIAREQIRDVIARYNQAGDRGRLDELVLCFTPQGAIQIKDEPPVRGREAIRERLGGAVRDLAGTSARRLLRHHVSSTRIELLSPREASARSYYLVVTEIGPDHCGLYLDRLERDGDAWRIAHRRVTVDWKAPGTRFPDPAPDAGGRGA
jgi:hypothetical protein